MKGHIWQTFGYFLSWGLFYGVLLGGYVGTAFYPLLGTMIGTIAGLALAVVLGLLSAIMASVMQALFFHDAVDLEAYSRRLSRVVGSVGGIGALILVVVTTLRLIPEPSIRQSIHPIFFNPNDPFLWNVLMFSSLPTFLLAGLSAAYTAYLYPAAIIQRMAQRGRLIVPQEAMRPIPQEIKQAFNLLAKPPRWLYLGAGVISFGGFLIASFQQWPITAYEVPVLLLAGPGGAIAMVLAWAYCAFGNAMILTFLKRVVYPASFSAYWHRVSLTFISFVITWAMIWWTTIPAPIIAATMASFVYRTLALPDETIDKARGEQKNAHDDEGENLLNEAQLIEAHQR